MRKGFYVLVFATFLIVAFVLFQPRQLANQYVGKFVPPDKAARLAAIGKTDHLSPELQAAFAPTEQFAPIPEPGPSDWLAQHRETGQTFEQFMRGAPNRPNQMRHKLYMLPLGDFDSSASLELDLLKQFARAFFAMEVEFLPVAKLDGLPIKIRQRSDQQQQLLTTDVLAWLEGQLPEDAYCLLAITMEDLYPQESWNFVFGQASLSQRVGVYSFARYAPEFLGRVSTPEDAPHTLMLSCKILSHETGHMFGIKHCVHFHCLMNGSNHQDESDRTPIHLCPVCLRKLQSSLGFDVKQRYESLKVFSDQVGWDEESKWLEERTEFLKNEAPGT